MTRISLVDIEHGRRDHCIIMMDKKEERRIRDRSRESEGRRDHCIIMMEQGEERRIRDRSRESEARESPSKRAYNGDNLVFETRIVDCEGEEQTFGAIGIIRDEASNLSWKQFKNYMIRNGGIEKIFPTRKSEVKVFYVDDEDDEIFVDTDDEYRELLKIASAKNKNGEWMILKFVSVSKTRRNLELRRRSCGDRKADLLSREVKCSPGKVMKHQTKHFDTVSGKIWKINGGKRGKVPGKMVPILGNPAASKPVTIAEGLNEVKELSRSLEEVKVSPCRRIPKSPESHEMMKQQASVFDWMSNIQGQEEKETGPPSWFVDYMENYKDEVAAEITTKVVHSLGIIIENKLAGLVERNKDGKVDESDFAKKVHKDKVKVKKVKAEAMRMTMDLGEEVKESKEMKKLKKSLIKKTDKVVKVAMKIEKKNQQEQKTRKTSISSSNNSEMQGIKLAEKKEKKAAKVKEEKKVKKTKPRREDIVCLTDDEVMYSVGPPARSYPVSSGGECTDDSSPCMDRRRSVVTSQPRYNTGILDRAEMSRLLKENQPMVRHASAPHHEVSLPSSQDSQAGVREVPGDPGRLVSAVFLSSDNRLVRQLQPGQMVEVEVSMINMGGLNWDHEMTVQRAFSSQGLSCPSSTLALPHIRPGQEGVLHFPFTAPQAPGPCESVWHFWHNNTRFGPPLKFKFSVSPKPGCLMLPVPNIGGEPREMRGIGISALSQEMVDMSRVRTVDAQTVNQEEEEEEVSQGQPEPEDGFDLLASEVDTLTLGHEDNSETEEEFEVIPVPDCFNLEVPFEIVDKSLEKELNNNDTDDDEDHEDEEEEDEDEEDDEEEEQDEDEEEGEEEEESGEEVKSPLEEALVAVKLVQEKLEKEKEVSSILNKISVESQEAALVQRLVDIGFANRAENIKMLRQNDNDIEKVLREYFVLAGTSWAEQRH